MFTCDKLKVQNVLENALEKLSSGLKLQNFPGGACPQTPPSFRALCARKASLHLLTFSPPAQKHLPTPLSTMWSTINYYHYVTLPVSGMEVICALALPVLLCFPVIKFYCGYPHKKCQICVMVTIKFYHNNHIIPFIGIMNTTM